MRERAGENERRSEREKQRERKMERQREKSPTDSILSSEGSSDMNGHPQRLAGDPIEDVSSSSDL